MDLGLPRGRLSGSKDDRFPGLEILAALHKFLDPLQMVIDALIGQTRPDAPEKIQGPHHPLFRGQGIDRQGGLRLESNRAVIPEVEWLTRALAFMFSAINVAA